MDLDRLGFNGMALLEGERVDLALSLRRGLIEEPVSDQEVMLLTNQRIIHLSRNGGGRQAAFASLRDVQAVEIRNAAKEKSSLTWGILGLLAALILFQVLKSTLENPFVAAAAGLVAGLLGVVLILDYLFSPGKALLVLQVGSAQIRGHIQSNSASKDIYTFINRVFQLKTPTEDADGGRAASQMAEAAKVPQDGPSPTVDLAPHPGSRESEHPGEDAGSQPPQS